MHLIHKDLTKIDALNDPEDMARQNRVEAHIKSQQHYTYPVISVGSRNSPADRDTHAAQYQPSMIDYNEKVRQWNDTSCNTQRSPPMPSTPTKTKHQHQGKRTSSSYPHHQFHRKGYKKVWNKHQRSKYKSAHRKLPTKQKEHGANRPQKNLGMRLLEKFTSPNIEIDHITVNRHPKSRTGLFNKGKTSARAKGVEDLVFSEASFFNGGTQQQHSALSATAKTSISKNETSTEKMDAKSSSHPSPLSSSSEQSVNEKASCSTDGVYGFFESTKKNVVEEKNQPTVSTTHTQQLQDTVVHTTNPSYHQGLSQLPTQSPQKAVLIEPDLGHYDNRQQSVLYGTSKVHDFTVGRAPFGNQQAPYYTCGTTPLDSIVANSIKEGPYNYATLSYDDGISEHSNYSNNNPGIRYGSVGSDTLMAYDSTSMINDPQHFQNKRNHWHLSHQPSHLENIDPSLLPLAKRGIFKLSGCPTPFNPYSTITSKYQPLYGDTSSAQRKPRVPLPIYNINNLMDTTSTTLGLGDIHDHSSNVISIGSDSKDTQQQQENVIEKMYHWRPNYQLNPATQQHGFYDQHQLQQHQRPINTPLDDDGLTPFSPPSHQNLPFITHSYTIHPQYSSSVSSSALWEQHASY